MPQIVILLYISITVTFLCLERRRTIISPNFIFVLVQLLMFIGIIMSPDAKSVFGQRLAMYYLLSIICYLLGVVLVRLAYKSAQKPAVTESVNNRMEYIDKGITKLQLRIITIIIITSVIVNIMFYSVQGANLLLKSVANFLSKGRENISTERLGFFRVGGVGYVHQFRAVLLPILTLYLLSESSKKQRRMGFVILPFMVIFLLGTGQRNAFVFFLAICAFYILSLKEYLNLPIKIRQLLIPLILSFSLLIILTISNGRVDYNSSNLLVGSIKSLLDRVVGVNSRTAIFAFRYMDSLPTVWGRDWLMMLMDILPGKTGYQSVARKVYLLAYGTDRGTGPPCIWGNAWYNWGLLGITLFPLVLGIVYTCVSKMYKRKREKNRFDIVLYVSLSIYLGLWYCEGPMTLFNNGAIAVCLLIFLTRNHFIREKEHWREH